MHQRKKIEFSFISQKIYKKRFMRILHYIFVIYLRILAGVLQGYSASKITDADYVDDLALFSNQYKDEGRMLHLLKFTASIVGLKINVKKTEYMIFKGNGNIKSIRKKLKRNCFRMIVSVSKEGT